jgi:mRNA interferase RelE/StbE
VVAADHVSPPYRLTFQQVTLYVHSAAGAAKKRAGGAAADSRIKKLRGLRRPQYRLRVGDIRVFYDLSGTTVQVLAIVAKSEAESWLAQFGNPE